MNKDEFAAQTPFPIGQANGDYAQYFTFSSRVATIIGISTMQRAAADRF